MKHRSEQAGIATVANRQFWRVTILVATTVASPIGCGDRPPHVAVQSGDVTPTGFHHHDPEKLLVGIFQRYRAAQSYSDHGRVCLVYDLDGRQQRQWAPLSVRLERQNFYVQAYSLRCFCDSTQTLCWIKDETTDDFDHQVSVRPAPKTRGDWETLTLDLIFQQHLSAGLGGPPPQLDWLFAAEPMKLLFDQQHRFEFGSEQSIENRRCQSVIVRADAKRYTFWIDMDAGIVREVELPSVFASPGPGSPPVEMTLTVQLSEATFQPSTQPPTVDPLPNEPKFVDRFVPLPPDEPDRSLGLTMNHELLQGLGAAGRPANVSLLVCFRDPQVSMALMELLSYWHRQLPADMASQVRVLELRRPTADQTLTSTVLAADPNRWASAFGSSSGGIGVLSKTGELLWTQPGLVPAELPALGTIVADVLAGIDVPRRLRGEWRTAKDAYDMEIQRRYRPPN